MKCRAAHIVQDSFPGVPMEAAAMCRPILSFRVSGIREQLTHPRSIRMVRMGDMAAIAPHAMGLIENPEFRRQMGGNASVEVRSEVSLQEHVGQVDNLYRELL